MDYTLLTMNNKHEIEPYDDEDQRHTTDDFDFEL